VEQKTDFFSFFKGKGNLNEFTSNEFVNMIRKNTEPFRYMMAFYRCAAMEVETKFRVLNEEMALESERNPIESISTRIKQPESILQKMRRKNIPLDREIFEKSIFDVAGVRVICAFPEDIYFLEECFLKQDDISLFERKDYVKNPKANGYRSLHLIVEVPIFLKNEKKMMKVEVQLRTIAMDFWASLEHKLRYKKNIDEGLLRQLSGDLLDCANRSAELDEKMQEIRNRIERER